MSKVALGVVVVVLISILIVVYGLGHDLNDGIKAYQSCDYETAIQELKPLAKKGDAEAQYWLGAAHDGRGWGTKSDGAEAMRWWGMAADQGHPDAQYEIGYVYESSLNDSYWGVVRSPEEAKRWYLMAAEQGHVGAQIKLSNMSPFGPEGEKWNRLAAETGNAEAQFKLGRRYQHGWGLLRDDEESVKWFRLSAEQGYTDAQFALAGAYEFGRGINQSDIKSYVWYTVAEMGSDMLSSNKTGVAERMNVEEVAEAKRYASECFSSNYQHGCK